MGIRRVFRWLPCAALLLAPCAARGQGSGRSLDLDPSVRSSGMGGASNAVFWDENANQWSNPALLGYARGLAYEWGGTKLAPSLANDVRFTSNVVKLGGAGFGFMLSGRPVGVGGLHLSYGESEGVDPAGNPTGAFETYEQIDSWGFGLSAARVTEAIATLLGRDPTVISRYGDVSFGMAGKHLKMQIAPDPSGRASTSAHDWGLLVRVSPLELAPSIRDFLGVDVARGWSDLSYDGEPVVFQNADMSSPPSEHHRDGLAGRLRVDLPKFAEQMPGPEWLWSGMHPLLSLGFATDHAKIGVPGSEYTTDGYGFEVSLANVFTLRNGRYEDLFGAIEGDTDGWGVGLPIGQVAGIRYDHAKFPQSKNSGLGDIKRNSVSAWIDAVRVWRHLRS